MYYHRYLEPAIETICFQAHKMAFVSGPRQCGKTTMAKLLLKQRGATRGGYYNWDDTKFRRLWIKDPSLVLPTVIQDNKPMLVLDELHKAKFWKRSLKGIYDTQDHACDILVTGSARLNIYRKESDSLMGRYYHFRLHPFSMAEFIRFVIAHKTADTFELSVMKGAQALSPDFYARTPARLITDLFDPNFVQRVEMLLSKTLNAFPYMEESLEKLYEFGPFPEPLFAANTRTLNLWRRNRVEKIIREDLRDLSRLPELSQVEMLASLLPERVAQPLSMQGLSEDIGVAYTTIKRWLNYLHELYYAFSIKPYATSLPRTLKKESKLYLWDWTAIEDPGARYENLIAAHLLKYCDYFTDTGEGLFELRYLRNKEKHEIDFLITKNHKPFLPIDAKLSDEQPSSAWPKFMKYLKCSVGLQVVKQPHVFRIHEYEGYKILVISAPTFLHLLI